MHKRLSYFVIAVALVLAACSKRADEAAAVAPLETWLPLAIGEASLEAQVALTPAEQQKGLMHRDSLPPNGGMLFPYRQPQQLSFWMANTRIPLDIGFFDRDGVLLEIHHMVPYDTSATHSRSHDVQYALEMPSGWFSARDLLPGDRLDMALLADALRRRGADPAAFGISGKAAR